METLTFIFLCVKNGWFAAWGGELVLTFPLTLSINTKMIESLFFLPLNTKRITFVTGWPNNQSRGYLISISIQLFSLIILVRKIWQKRKIYVKKGYFREFLTEVFSCRHHPSFLAQGGNTGVLFSICLNISSYIWHSINQDR